MMPPYPNCPLCRERNAVVEMSWRRYQLFKCHGCGLTYAWPPDIPPALYEEAHTEQGLYHEYLSRASRTDQGKLHLTWAMRNLLRAVKPIGHLLDIGCSTGLFLLQAKQRGWHVTGLEVSERAAAVAREVTGAAVYVGVIEEFRPPHQFDVITAWEILEHVVDPVTFIRVAAGLLRPGGILALSVPNWNSPWMKRSTRKEHWPPYHLTFWNRRTLSRLLTQESLYNVDIREKPFAWTEEVGSIKWVYLPLALGRSILLNQKGMHLFGMARMRPGANT